MAIFELKPNEFAPLTVTLFENTGHRERKDLQRLLKQQIEIVAPDTLVISEEFSDWDDSRRSVDLLAIDINANLVAIELKRTEDGGHMELQAIRYAAMISAMTFDRAVDIYDTFLKKCGEDKDAKQALLDFLGWVEADEEAFAQDVRIVLVSAGFSKEITTAVLWLNERQLDIQCVRITPYTDGNRYFVDIQRIIPLPEAEAYQVKLRDKQQKEREDRGRQWDHSSFMRDLEDKRGKQVRRSAESLYDWMASLSRVELLFGSGKERGSFTPILKLRDARNGWHHLFVVWPDGTVAIRLDALKKRQPLADGSPLNELINDLNQIEGIQLEPEKTNRPRFDIQAIVADESMSRFKQAYDKFIAQLQKDIDPFSGKSGDPVV